MVIGMPPAVVYFEKGSKDGALEHFLSAPLLKYRDWLVRLQQNGPDSLIEVGDEHIALIDDIIGNGAAALLPNSQEHVLLIDRIIQLFYFWGVEEAGVLVAATSSNFEASHYHDVAPKFAERFGAEAGKLWDYLLHGRPLGRSEDMYPCSPRYEGTATSFWTHDEVRFLYTTMLPHKNLFSTMFEAHDICAVNTTFEAVEIAFNEGVGLIIEIV